MRGHSTRLHGSVLPSKQNFTLALSRILSSLLWGEYIVPSSPPDASHLCARGKGRGLSIKGEPCKCVLLETAGPQSTYRSLQQEATSVSECWRFNAMSATRAIFMAKEATSTNHLTEYFQWPIYIHSMTQNIQIYI